MKKDLAYYRTLPYTRLVEQVTDEAGSYYVARIEELRGCLAAGDTRLEAVANLKGAFDEYIEALLGWGSDIPEPQRVPHPAPQVSGWTQPPQGASGPPTGRVRVRDSMAESTG